MSKYTEELRTTFPTMKEIKQATRDLIKDGGKLALEEYHEAKSLEKLKKQLIKEVQI